MNDLLMLEADWVKKVIAVDDGLTPVRSFLTEQGCQVINVEAAKNQRVDVVVLSGIDENSLLMRKMIKYMNKD